MWNSRVIFTEVSVWWAEGFKSGARQRRETVRAFRAPPDSPRWGLLRATGAGMNDWQQQVLDFWFGGSDEATLDRSRPAWFRKRAAFDAEIHKRFLPLWQRARAGELSGEVQDALGALALLIVLDQFPRNLFRGHADAFATDLQARELVKTVLQHGWDKLLPPVARGFVYLPLEHSEDLADQELSVQCFESLPESPEREGMLDYARRHHAVIARFGRFPHRNGVMGRENSEEEAAFLQQPGSSF